MAEHDPSAAASIAPSTFEPLSEQGPTPAGGGGRNWRAIPIVTGLIFFVIMAFLLTARSLEVKVLAQGEAEITLSGGLYLPFGGRYLLRQGEYQVTAEAPGYHPLVSEVTVTGGDSQTLELTLQPLPGRISFVSQPPGAKILVDGDALGNTPLRDHSVESGEHQLRFELDRYLPLEQALTVTGRQVEQQIEMALAPAWADVSIDSNPPGASILVDGEVVGTTPAVVELLQGERQLILQKEGFAHWRDERSASAGEAQDLGTISLTPAAGILQLSSAPTGANVTVDGEFQGQTPLSLELSPGRNHRVSVFKPGYRRHNSSIAMAAGENNTRSVKLVAQLGEVRFNITPANAVLRINGRPRGQGSQTLSLPAFEQSVEVVLAGYATVRQRITPRPGLQQVINVGLQTERDSRLARIKPEITTALGQTLLLFNPAESHGDFTMGASRREPGRRANEVLHPVSLTRMFYLQTTEITNAQFRLFAASHNSGQIEGNSLNREHQPAVQVSWQQAAQFCNWLSKREGLPPFYQQTNGIVTGFNSAATGYRLPSEAEWAWAAKVDGPELRKFPWGDSFPPTAPVENYADNTSAYVTGVILNGYTDGHVVTATVATFPPNQHKLYDMGGNVAEWVHDVYAIPPANGATQTDPLGAPSGDNYVIRGASWTHSKISDLRLSHRDYGQAGRDDVGFRLARYAE
jgi:formylglycine-generating enzyme required for sulfatase activity